jgi:hypothetical protein
MTCTLFLPITKFFVVSAFPRVYNQIVAQLADHADAIAAASWQGARLQL